MGNIKTFKDLIIWQKAHELVISVYKEITFPANEQFGLESQMKRSAVSVPANIAEGFKRISKQEKIRFYNIAQSSLQELEYYFILLNDLSYVESEEYLYRILELNKMFESILKKFREPLST